MAMAGEGGVFTLHYLDNKKRFRAISGYPGEDGILPDCWYAVKGGKLVKVE